MSRRLWTKEELILAFNLYLKLPFGKFHASNPEVINLANLTGRSNNSIAIRLSNFASCDPYHQNRGVKGLVGGLKQCQPIWDEFFHDQEKLIYLSEQILASKEKVSIEEKFKSELGNLSHLTGENRVREVSTRVNQSIFRKIVLMNYDNKCAISGIDVPDLLVASHIIPWSQNKKERLNPQNGLCLNYLHDKAFDRGLITFDKNFKMVLSNKLKRNGSENMKLYFHKLEGKSLKLPKRFIPNEDFLEYHKLNIFQS
ncbi:HNH endonuclease [uncultured Winogradskyella sp.]|uniref:HNH endonuclease n=1 Tax=Winogradskyella sp. 4-2091 TaxID=3381659 RepID=UPI0026098403|nr:HNH endonuclease [uncultured Winogradskyella sp.]